VLPLPDVAASDKLHHLVAYAALALPVAMARPRRWWLVPVALLAWSGAIELVQPYVSRDASWADLGANATGLMLGVLLASVLRRACKVF
jgi:VanZ family protein